MILIKKCTDFIALISALVVLAPEAACLQCCCLVKAVSSEGRLVVTSGSLIKWIWFLRGNSWPLSLGARATLVSI